MVAHPDDPEQYSLFRDLLVILVLLGMTAGVLGGIAYAAWTLVGEASSGLEALIEESDVARKEIEERVATETEALEKAIRETTASPRAPVDVVVELARTRMKRGRTVLRGTATNRASATAYDTHVEIIAFDRTGQPMGTATAQFEEPFAPNEQRDFVASPLILPKRPARFSVSVSAFNRPRR